MIPFDTRYTPDLIFATRSRLSEKFPHDTGQGVLNLMYPERAYSEYANLAHCAVIVDDYLIQFSERGNMYVLDIPTNKVSTYQIVESDISMELSDWLKNTASTAVKMMKAIEKDSEAQYFLQLYGATLFYHTMPAPERQRNYNQANSYI